ncbi:Tautomerase/MIF [Fistulina hepatica ATCC 64428]|uniref:L-dopachrome isomerase n=1 Tax=Fistulina hepatica ATCC 64428 TaxID=1128425 RepID=A0A0D7A421_9AGAR|nr:Tautomerase/MIF [Fistulina hepatica ATCC 64428]
MPALEIITNVKVDDTKAFIQDFSQKAAAILGKPVSYISASITHNESVSFGGTFEPAFRMTVISLGNVNPAANIKYSKQFFQYFKDKLGISNDRGYITYIDPGNANLGYKSTTFGEIFG